MEDKLVTLSDKKNETLISILQKITEEDRYYSLDYLSNCIHVSTRTVQRYVNLLEDYTKRYHQEKRADFELIQTSRGVRLIIERNANINFFISYLLQKDDTIQLLMSLLLQEYSSINDYMAYNFLGAHNISKSIEMITPFLKEFNLEIDKKRFTIVGSELTIRFLMQNIFWLVHRCDDFPSTFQGIEINKLKGDISYLTENLNLSSDNPVKEKDLIFRIAISLLRYQKKELIQLSDEQKKNVPIYQNQFDNSTLYELVETILNNHNIYNSEETYFLVISFLNNSLMYTSKSLKRQLLAHHTRNNTMALKATVLFLERFQESIYEIPHEKMETVFEFIFISHFIASIDTNQFHDYNSYIFDEVRTQSPQYIDQLERIIEELRTEEQLVLFNKQDYLLNRYMMLKYFLNLKLLYKKPIKIKLYSDFPDVYEDFIKNYLTTLFKNDYKLLFIDNDSYQESDLILTSYLMSELGNKCISISYPLTNREITDLKIKFDALEN